MKQTATNCTTGSNMSVIPTDARCVRRRSPTEPQVSLLTHYANGALWSALIVPGFPERFVIVKRRCLINGETSK